MKAEEYVGQKFGRLTVVGFTLYAEAQKQGKHETVLHCRCDCGEASDQYISNIRRVTSCGCFRTEFHTKHGMSHDKVYAVWVQMIQRCDNPKAVGYKMYGGAGIKVHHRWYKFENFIKDMGPRPEGTTIDRKDGTKGYSPNNCRWATPAEQSRNMRTNFKVKVGGKTIILEDAVRDKDISRLTVLRRIREGWSIEEAISTPPKMVGRRVWLKDRGMKNIHDDPERRKTLQRERQKKLKVEKVKKEKELTAEADLEAARERGRWSSRST